VADGAPPLKLPYNAGDDVYTAADRFIAEHGLPISYREQIVDFILQNAGAAAPPPQATMMNADPFTGGGAYVPSAAPAGLSATQPQSLPPMLLYDADASKAPLMKKKLGELAGGTAISTVVDEAVQRIADGTSLQASDVEALHALATSLPSQVAFPAVDLLRLALAVAPTQVVDALYGESNGAALSLLACLSAQAATRSLGSLVSSLKCACNMHRSTSLKTHLQADSDAALMQLLSAFADGGGADSHEKVSVRQAFAALVQNHAVAISAPGADVRPDEVLSQLFLHIASLSRDADGEVVSRAKRAGQALVNYSQSTRARSAASLVGLDNL